MKLVSGSLLITLASTAAIAAAPQATPAPAAQVAPAADSGERLDLARKFVGLTMDENSFLDGMRAMSLQFASQKLVESEDGADTPPEVIEEGVDKFIAKFRPVLHSKMPKLLDAYAQVYAREFTTDELRTMNAFAASPAGRHFLNDKDVGFGDEGVVKAQLELRDAMQPIGEELRREECAKKAAARVAAGDKKATCPLAKAAESRQG